MCANSGLLFYEHYCNKIIITDNNNKCFNIVGSNNQRIWCHWNTLILRINVISSHYVTALTAIQYPHAVLHSIPAHQIIELNDLYMCGPMNWKGFLCQTVWGRHFDGFAVSFTSMGSDTNNTSALNLCINNNYWPPA